MLLHAHALLEITLKAYHKSERTTTNTNIRPFIPLCNKAVEGYNFLTSGRAVTSGVWELVEGLPSGCAVTSGGLGSHFRSRGHFRGSGEQLENTAL